MIDEPPTDALRRLAERESRPRSLAPDAQTRIEARVDAAFSDEASQRGSGRVLTFDTLESRQRARRPWLPALAGVAASVLLVVGLASLRSANEEPVADAPAAAVPVEWLDAGTRWLLTVDPEVGADGTGATASLSVRITGDQDTTRPTERVVGGQARVQTGDVPPRQYLGSVEFVAEPSGRVRVPLILLDPERASVDCDATIELGGSGTATCGTSTVDYVAGDTATDVIVTPAGSYDASGSVIEWMDTSSPATTYTTTIWISRSGGLVRLEIEDGDSQRIYELLELDIPEPAQPAGD